VDQKKKNCGTITFTLGLSEYTQGSQRELIPHISAEDATKLDSTSRRFQLADGAVSGMGETISDIASMYNTWQPLMDKIQVIVAIAGMIAEVLNISSTSILSLNIKSMRRFIHMHKWLGLSSRLLSRFVVFATHMA
jgi:hypothetical protein